MTFELFNIYTTSLIFFIFLFINLNKTKNIEIINKSESTKDSRIYFFDFIKGISIIAVVLIHIAYFYYDFNTYGNLSLYQDYIIKIFRYAVPFFIISSGFLLNIKNLSFNNIVHFYKSKFIRLVLPYFIFCIVFFIINNHGFNLGEFFYGFITGNISTPYYFMSVLLQLYIIYPIIFVLMNKFDNKKILIFSFIVSFVSSLFLYQFNNFYLFLPYLIYFTFGIYLKRSINNTNILDIIKSNYFIKFNLFIILLYLLFGLIGLSDHYSNFQFAYSISLFLILFACKEKIENKFGYIKKIGQFSFYIFLSHFFIMQFIFKFIQNKFSLNVEFFLFATLSILFGIFLPFLISFYIKKIASRLLAKTTKNT